MIIRGTVLAQSPAQPGTPCVSAESMSEWMNYLHTQGTIPSNIIGVPVSIDAVDPNGNFVHIANVVSDGSGVYSYLWEPEIEGKYAVTATFMGDDSYGSSYATTAVGVVEAPVTSTPEPSTQQMPAFEMYFAASTIAIIAAIVIVGFLFRKRP